MQTKPITMLPPVDEIRQTDVFVMEQDGVPKKLSGQVLINWLTKAADGHGGIRSIEKISTTGLVDTYRIYFADTTTHDFDITNGKDGFSPSATVTQTETGVIITITDANGTTSATVSNGKDGYTPAITIESVTGQSKTLPGGRVESITSVSVEAGTYLVFANATFPSYLELEKANYTHILGVNTSTIFDHGKATSVGNVKDQNLDLNVATVLTLPSDGTIYMLGYVAEEGTVTNCNLFAVKLGGGFGSGGNGENGGSGFTPIATVTQTETGAEISITDKNGTTTATITNGKDGVDGYTPVKGVDYYTEVEQAELDARIVEEVAKYVSTGDGETEDVAVDSTWDGWTVHESHNVNSACKMVANYPDYTTYTAVVDKDTSLWFKSYPTYACIAVYPSGIVDTDGTNATGAARYRVADSNLPTVDNPLTVSAGYAIAVTVNVGKNFTLWGLKSIEKTDADFTGTIESIVGVKLNSLQNGRIAVKFSKTSTYQRITVYHAANGDYCIGQTFERVPNADKNSDVWHLKYAYFCNSKTLEQVNANPNAGNYFEGQIVNNGEWENAIKETGQDDFMGGTLHGNEIMTAVHFFLDGKPLDMAAGFLLYGDELKVIGITELYRVNDNAVKVADRSCVWTFKNGEITVNQTHKFAVDVMLVSSYTMMFPINKMYSENFLVTGNPALLNFPKESTNKYNPDFAMGVKEQLTNTFGNGVVCEVLVSCSQPGTWLMQDNGNEYNKMYFNIGNRNYSAGDTILTKSIYRMMVGKQSAF